MIATLRYIRLHVIPIIVWIIYLSQSNVFMIWYYEHEVTITRCRSLSFRPPWTHLLIVLSLLLYKWHNVLVYKWHNVLVYKWHNVLVYKWHNVLVYKWHNVLAYMVKFKCYVNRIGERGWAFVSVNKRCTYLLTYFLTYLGQVDSVCHPNASAPIHNLLTRLKHNDHISSWASIKVSDILGELKSPK